VPSASLLHRGEQFRYADETGEYEGECVWSWEETATGPRRVYPVTLLVRTIGRTDRKRIPRDEKARVALAARALLGSQDPSGTYEIAES
jgi:hypothetical protein